MAKDYSNKVQFFSKKGTSIDLLNFICDLDPGKHFNWFVSALGKFNIFDEELKKHCLSILNMFNKSFCDYPRTLEDAIQAAKKFKEFEDSYDSRVLHTFEDGVHVYLLSVEELHIEGSIMTNCLGNYISDVKNKHCAIISLRDKNKKSLVNVQVFPNGGIGQNFEKGNRQVKFSNWKYISTFFSIYGKKLNSIKGIDGSENFLTLTLQGEDFSLPMLAQGIPTSVRTFINETGEIKTISDNIHFTKTIEGTNFDSISEFGDADHIIKHLEKLKSRFEQAIDRLKSFALELEEKSFFLNDDIKQKIFGEDYKLKNEISNISEIITSFAQKPRRRNHAERLREAIDNLAGAVNGFPEDAAIRNGDDDTQPVAPPVIEEEVLGRPDEDVHARLNLLIQRGHNIEQDITEEIGEERVIGLDFRIDDNEDYRIEIEVDGEEEEANDEEIYGEEENNEEEI